MYRATYCMAVWFVFLAVASASADDFDVCGNGSGGNRVIAACTGALRLAPSDTLAYAVGKGDHGQAIAHFDEASNLDPGYAGAQANRVGAVPARGRGEVRVAQMLPRAGTSADLAECVKGADTDVQRRIAACTRAIAENPGNKSVLLPAHLARANLHQQLKQWDRVVGDCNEILRLAPPGEIRFAADALRRVALTLMRQSIAGAQSNAPASTAAVAPSAPPSAPARSPTAPADLLECVNGARNDVVHRIAACTRAIAQNPGNNSVLLPAHLARANLHQQLRQWDRVVADCDEVLRLAPQPEIRSAADGLRRVALAILQQSGPGAQTRLPAPAQTQTSVTSQPWPSLNARVLEALKQGDYGQGTTKLAEDALDLARRAFGDRAPQTLASLTNLAALYTRQARYSEAEPLLRQVMQAERAALGDRNPQTLTAVNNLASVYQHQGRNRDAEPLFKEVLQRSREVRGPRHPDTLLVMNNLADLYKEEGRYREAESLFKEALQTRRQVLGIRHPDTLVSVNNLAALYHKEGRYGEAETLYREALEARREMLGPRHPDTLRSLNNLAVLYKDEGHYGEAEPLFREALQERREALGGRHPDTVVSLNNLAVLYVQQGRYREAEPLLREALQVLREALGARHPDTFKSLNNLASLYEVQGRYGEAEPLLREALQAQRDALGARHPDTLTSLNNLANLYQKQGRYDEAEPLYREALETMRAVLGTRHPETLKSLNNLASLYQSQRRFGDAEALFKEALQTNREVQGNRHPDTLNAVSNLAVLYLEQGRRDEAEPLFREVLQARREVLGDRHPQTLTSLNNLAAFYSSNGRNSEAEPLYRELVQTSRDVLGPRHPEALTYRLNFVINLISQDKRAEAVGLLREMEPDVLGWIGQELHSTGAGATRRQLVSSQAQFQDVVMTLATAEGASADARRLAAATMLQFKVLQGEEEAYLARLARQSQDPRVHALVSDIGRLREMLAAAVQGPPGEFEKMLKALEAKEQELVRISPEYDSRLRVLNAGLDDVRKALPAGSALVEFRQFRPLDVRTSKLGEPRFAALLVTGAGEPAVADLGPVSELQPLAAALGGGTEGRGLAPGPHPQSDPLLQAVASRGFAPAPQQQPDEALALYERLVQPFKDAVAAAKTVYVAPDGILNLVPFARLKRPDGHYWFESQQIRMLQTGRDLLRPGADHRARGLVALGGIDFDAGADAAGPQDSTVFAAAGSDRKAAVDRAARTFRLGFPPLPATAAEAKEVTASYKKRYADEPAELWSGAAATKARLMALKSPPRVLHLATHGFYLPNQSREPMLLSGIALAGANREVTGAGNEGLLFALEAEGLNLDGTELVVLSACDTAKGNLDYSEGVFGLARGLRTAGARNVLVTLWPLDDVLARDFMADFYKNWLNDANSDPAKALRDTQLQWIKQADRSDPRAWAPYVVIE